MLYDDVHNVLHRLQLLPKLEKLNYSSKLYPLKVPLVSHPKGFFFAKF